MGKMKGKILALAVLLAAVCTGYSYGKLQVCAEKLSENRKEWDKEEEAQADIWKVEISNAPQQFYAEDGTELLLYDCQVFTLCNGKDGEAAKKVMDALKREEETLEPYLEFANEDYYNMRNSGVQENFRSHYYGKEYMFTEVNGYLSVVCQDLSFSGGAHPNISQHAYVFAPDGTRLYLSDLFKNVDETREMVIAKLRPEMWKLCKDGGQESAPLNEVIQNMVVQLEEMGRYERIFSDFFTDGEYGNEEQCWYLDEEGIILLANPYKLGGYSGQVQEFHVSGKMINDWKCPVYDGFFYGIN